MSTTFDAHLISTKEASELSGYNPDYLARLCRSGKLVGRQVGRAWLIDKRSLESFVREQGERKEARAQELSRAREAEYRQAQLPATPAHVVTTIPVMAVSPARLIANRTKRPLVFSPTAAFVLSVVLVVGTVYAGNSPELAGLILRAGSAAIDLASSEAVTGSVHLRPYAIATPEERAAAYLAPAKVSYASLPSGLALGAARDHLIALAPSSSEHIDFARTGARQGDEFVARAKQDIAQSAFTATHPALLAFAAAASAQDTVARIERGELLLVSSAGEQLLSAGATVRDSADTVARTDPAGALAVRILNAYAGGIQRFADAAPQAADAGARTELALGTRILSTGDALTQLLGTSADQAPAQAADLALGAAGNAILGVESLGTPQTSAAGAGWDPNALLALTARAAPWFVPQPVYSVGERIALSVYGSFHGIFNDAGRALALLFGNPQSDTKLTVVPFAGTTAPQRAQPSAPVIISTPTQAPSAANAGGTVVKNTYVTNNFFYTAGDVVSHSFLTESLDRFAMSSGGSSSVTTDSVSHVLLTSMLTVKDLLVTNGATVNGALSVGTITATGAVNGAYFTATSVSATSTLPNLVSNSFTLGNDYFTRLTGNGLVVTNGTLNVATTSLASGFFLNGGNTFGGIATLGTKDANAVQVITNNLPRVTFDAVGNVGIGTTAPAANLHVVSTSTPATLTLESASSDARLRLKNGNGNFYNLLTQSSDNTFRLQYNGTNVLSAGPGGTLGVGSVTANAVLDVASTTATLPLLRVSTGGTPYLQVGNTGNVGIGTSTPSSLLSVAGNATVGADYNVAAPTNGLLVEGNVGIGTTSPGSTLSVAGSGLFSGDVNLNNFVARGGGTVAADLTVSGGIGAGQQNSNPGSILAVNNITTVLGQFIGRNAPIASAPTYSWTGDLTTGVTHPMNNAIGFNVGGQEMGRFDSSGFFGIGTTTPGYNFSVNGSGYITGNLRVGNSLIVQNGSVTLGSATSTLSVGGTIGSSLIPSINKTYDLGSPSFYWSHGYIDTLVANNISAASTTIGGTASASFTINSANATTDTVDMQLIFFRGLVNPNAVLSWNSATKRFEFNQPAFIQNKSSTTTVPTLAVRLAAGQTADLLPLQDPNGNVLSTFTNTGALGIGSSTPWAQLSVNPNGITGPAFAIGSSTQTLFSVTNAGQALITSGTNALPSYSFLSAPTTGFFYDSGNTAVDLAIGGGTQWRFGASGLINSGFANGAKVGGASASASVPTLIPNLNDSTTGIGASASGALSLITNGTDRIEITNAGNVGIGTTSPRSQLTVFGLGQTTAGLVDNGNQGGTIQITDNHDAGGAGGALTFSFLNDTGTTLPSAALKLIEVNGTNNGTGDLAFSTRNAGTDTALTERLRISAAGNVGIGTSSPSNILTVQSGTNDGLFLDQTNGFNKKWITLAGSSGEYGSFQMIANGIQFNVNTAASINKFVIPNGNVGIGTTSPAFKLDVVGGVNTDQYSGFYQNRNLILYASTTNFSTVAGVGAWVGATSLGVSSNSAFGYRALNADTTGNSNTAIGTQALEANLAGTGNTALGTLALQNSNTASNVAIGTQTLQNNSGAFNIGIGNSALQYASGNVNIGIGAGALGAISFSGANNVALGLQAGQNITSGSGNIILGTAVNAPSATANGQLNIGNVLFGTGLYNNSINSNLPQTNGAIGVGSTSPYAQLSIHAVNGSTNTTLFAIGSSTASATTTLFSVLNTGNVGIGTAAPAFKLDVAGPINTDQYSGFYQGGSLLGYASSTNTATIFGLGAGGQNATTSAAQNIVTAVGYHALNSLTTGFSNLAVGYNALSALKTGNHNLAIGYNALGSYTGTGNTANLAIGESALGNLTSGVENVAIGGAGVGSSLQLQTSSDNVLVGYNASNGASGLTNSVFIGANAGRGSSYTSTGSTYIGAYAGGNLLTSSSDYNTFVGNVVGSQVTSGYGNTLIGQTVGAGNNNLTTGGGNIGIGYNIQFPSGTGNNQLSIGNFLFGSLPATTTSSTFALPTSGALGVATSSPYATLSVHANNGSANTTLFAIGSSTASATTTLFSVLNTGSVGIGTANPSASLQIVGGSVRLDNNQGIQIKDNANGPVAVLTIDPSNNFNARSSLTTGDAIFGLSNASAAGSIHFQTAGANQVNILSNGNVGIGTSTPVATLAVQGNTFLSGDITNVGNITATGTVAVTNAITAGTFAQSGGVARINNLGVVIGSGNVLGFTSSANSSGTIDTALSRLSAGVVAVGTGAQGNTGGTLIAANIGIGTTTPLRTLTVIGQGNLPAARFDYPSGTGAIEITGNAGSPQNIYFGSFTDASLKGRISYDNSSNSLALYTNGGERLRIDSSGNVGIGTTSPSAALAVNGGAYFTNAPITVFSDAAHNFNSNLILAGTNAADIFGLQLTIGSNTWGTEVGRSAPGYFSISRNSSQKLTIDTSGNVGIGTTTPGAKLDVLGDQWLSLVANQTRSLSFRNLTNGTTYGRIQYADTTGVFDVGNLNAYPVTISTNGNERLRVDSVGNVGVGTTSPSSRLAVTGSGTGATRTFSVANSSNAEKFTILDNGSVGIGVSTFGSNGLLQIAGGIGLSGTQSIRPASNGDADTLTYLGTQLVIGDVNSAAYAYAGGSLIAARANVDNLKLIDVGRKTGSASFVVQDTTASELSLNLQNSGGTSVLYASTNLGNVGIGTTNPQAKLDVLGTASSTRFFADTGTVAAGFGYSFRGNTSAGVYLDTSNGLNLTNGSDSLQLLNGLLGNTNSNRAALSTGVPSATSPALTRRDDTTTGLGLGGSGVVSLITGGVDALHVASGGNIGIGSTTPSVLTAIERSTTQNDNLGTLELNNTQNTTGAGSNISLLTKNVNGTSQFMQWQNNGLRLGTRSTAAGAGNIYLTNNDTVSAFLGAGTGNCSSINCFGIGTTSPAEKIDVYGSGNSDVAVLRETDTASYSGALLDKFRTPTHEFHIGLSGTSNVALGADKFYIRDQTNSANRLVIDSSGNVGIGTSTPGGLLNVAASLNTTGGVFSYIAGPGQSTYPLSVQNNSGVTTFALGANQTINEGHIVLTAPSSQGAGAGIDFISGAGKTGSFQLDGSGNLVSRISNGSGSLYLDTSTGGSIIFRRNSGPVEQARFDSGGNFGIGSTTPSQALSVQGNALIAGNLNVAGITATSSFIGPLGSANAPTFQVGPLGTGIFGRTSGILGFTMNGTERASISAGGLALGTTLTLGWSPTNDPDAGADTAFSRLSAGVVAVGNGTANNTSGTLIAATVGIGTTTPSTLLNVNSTTSGGTGGLVALFSNTSANAGGLRFNVGPDAALSMLSQGVNVTSNIQPLIYNSTFTGTTDHPGRAGSLIALGGGGFSFQNFPAGSSQTSTVRLLVDPSGNVGIGTTSPTSKFTIQGPSTTFIASDGSTLSALSSNSTRYELSSNGVNSYGLTNGTNPVDGGVLRLGIGGVTASSYISGGQQGSALFNVFVGATSSPQLTIQSGGQVGIGTITAQGQLSVASAGITGHATSFTAWGNKFSLFGPNAGSATGAALGIGYDTTDDASAIYSLAPNVAWKPLYFNASSYNFYEAGAANPAMTISGSGNVGIGVASPTSGVLQVAAPSSGTAIAITGTISSSTTRNSGLFNAFNPLVFNFSSAATSLNAGIDGVVILNGAGGLNGGSFTANNWDARIQTTGNVSNTGNYNPAITGASFDARTLSPFNATISGEIVGGFFQVSHTAGAGTVAGAMAGIEIASPGYAAGGTVTGSVYGARIANQGNVAWPTSYGLAIDAQSGSTANNYALYSAGGTNYFGGNVGIGVATPNSLLQIGSSTAGANAILTFGQQTTASEAFLPTIQQASVLVAGTGNDLAIGSRSSNGGLLFYTGNAGSQTGNFGLSSSAVRLSITAGGLVGIGTTTQTNPFTVAASNMLIAGNSASTNGVYLKLQNYQGTNGWAIGAGGAIVGANDFSIGDNNNYRLVISGATGNVGIGTTTPQQLLEVGQGISNAANYIQVNATGNSGAVAGIKFRSWGVPATSYIQQDSFGSYSANTGSLGHGLNFASGRLNNSSYFFRDNNDNVGVAFVDPASTNEVTSLPFAANLLVGGKIGIGSTTPAGTLSVAISSTTPALFVGAAGSSTPSLFVAGANSNGLVGIGTSAPTSQLTVVNTAGNGKTFKFSDGTRTLTDGTSGVLSWNAAAHYGSGSFAGIGDTEYYGMGDGTNRASFYVHGFGTGNLFRLDDGNGATQVAVTAGGSFGIGTTTPAQTLSVQGNGLFSGNISAANLTATGTATLGIIAPSNSSAPLYGIYGNNATDSTGIIGFAINNSSVLKLQNAAVMINGNGVQLNSSVLTAGQTSGGIQSETIFNKSNSNTASVALYLANGSSDTDASLILNSSANTSGNGGRSLTLNANGGPLALQTGGTNALYINSSQQVGIGSSSPSAQFAIHAAAGSTNTTLFAIGSSTASATTTLFSVSNTGNAYHSGSVGIGTNAPAFKLDVAGPINTDQYSGFYQGGSLLAYASSTNGSVIFGYQAGGQNATTSSAALRATAVGYQALNALAAGLDNTAIGYQALAKVTSSSGNTAIGSLALTAATTGDHNVAVGGSALTSVTTGTTNTAVGVFSLQNVQSGTSNTGIGYFALNSALGFDNTAIGNFALANNSPANDSVAIGSLAGKGNPGSYSNIGGVYVGFQSGYGLTNGSSYNTFVGHQSGMGVSSGANNIILGAANISAAQNQITTGSSNIAIGYNVAVPSATASNQLVIGNLLYGTGINGTGATLSTGSIGIGTTTPAGKFSIAGAAGATGSLFLISSSTSGFATSTAVVVDQNGNFGIGTGTPTAQLHTTGTVRFANFGAGTLQTDANGNLTVSSDERLKDIAGGFTRGLADIQKLDPILFHWNAVSGFDQAALNAGFSAQNVQAAVPEAVGKDNRGYLTLQDRPILAAAVNAIKDLAGQASALSQATSSLSVQLASVQAQAAAAELAATAAAQLPANLTATRVSADTLAASGALTAGSVASAGTVSAGAFVAPSTATQYLIGSSTVAVNLPAEALTSSSTVDIYKLATFTLASVQNLANRFDTLSLKIDDLATRLAKLENASSTPGILPDQLFATSTAQRLLATVGFAFDNALTSIHALIAERLTVGTAEKPTGVTLYDEQTGAPYCVSIKNGSQQITQGACQVIDLKAQQAAAVTAPQIIITNGVVTISGTTTAPAGAPAAPAPASATSSAAAPSSSSASTTPAAPAAPADTTPPVVTLLGAAAMQISTGSAWNDPGATAHDAVDGDLTGAIKVAGAVNVNAPGLYTVSYSATDKAGNTGSVSRTVVVKDPAAPASAVASASQPPAGG